MASHGGCSHSLSPFPAALSQEALPAPLAQPILPLWGSDASGKELMLHHSPLHGGCGVRVSASGCSVASAAVRGRERRREQDSLPGAGVEDPQGIGPFHGAPPLSIPLSQPLLGTGLAPLLLYCSPGKGQGFPFIDGTMETQRGQVTCLQACT